VSITVVPLVLFPLDFC